MERTYIQWNIVNWITIFLMAMLGLLIVGMIGSAVTTYRARLDD